MAENEDIPQQSSISSRHEIRRPLARRVGLPPEPVVQEGVDASFDERVLESVDSRSKVEAPIAAKEDAKEEAQGEVTAVLVVHGMGQQIQFETLDQVERGLRRVEAERTEVSVDEQPRSIARSVLLGDQIVERLELPLTGPKGLTWVHLYEAYWAPLTEGKVTLRDVMAFLLTGGFNGLAKSRESFWRWMFDRRVDFGRQQTALKLLLALGVIGVLVLINAVVTAVAAVLLASPASASWLSPELLSDLTVVLVALVVLLLVLRGLMRWTKRMAFFRLAILVILGAGASMLVVLAWNRLGHGTPWHHLPSQGRMVKGLFVVFWLAFLRITYQVRSFLIQYLGDVAAYVSPHKLDRFNDIRNDIKAVAAKVAEGVYGALSPDGQRFEYQSVAVVGHSLGSVVAYDTLNALLNKDSLSGGRLRIALRTCLFLTFGSRSRRPPFFSPTRARRRARAGRL
jgi:hypothetical protein